MVEDAKPLPLPRALQHHWRGIDVHATATLLTVFGALCFLSFIIIPENMLMLTRASDALCGGDTEFLTTIDGAGGTSPVRESEPRCRVSRRVAATPTSRTFGHRMGSSRVGLP